jgi:hypothetical protein
MGYHTYYNVNLIPDDRRMEIIEDLRNTYESARWGLDEHGYCNQDMSWYSWNEDIRKFSEKYPDVLFVVDGEGDDTEDLWISYFQNGKNQHVQARIIYDPYDPEMME